MTSFMDGSFVLFWNVKFFKQQQEHFSNLFYPANLRKNFHFKMGQFGFWIIVAWKCSLSFGNFHFYFEQMKIMRKSNTNKTKIAFMINGAN